MRENMIDINGNHHDGTFLGACISVMCLVISIVPTILDWSEKMDRALVPFMHLTQWVAAIIAITVGLITISDKVKNWIKEHRNKGI